MKVGEEEVLADARGRAVTAGVDDSGGAVLAAEDLDADGETRCRR
jgi:hypothetical protein